MTSEPRMPEDDSVHPDRVRDGRQLMNDAVLSEGRLYEQAWDALAQAYQQTQQRLIEYNYELYQRLGDEPL